MHKGLIHFWKNQDYKIDFYAKISYSNENKQPKFELLLHIGSGLKLKEILKIDIPRYYIKRKKSFYFIFEEKNDSMICFYCFMNIIKFIY